MNPSSHRGYPTTYRGKRFRSRLEVKWAVFLDLLHQPWLYEPRRFELEDESSYLPDFWLPAQACWYEVKPVFTPGEGMLQRGLALRSAPVVVAVGLPTWPSSHPLGQLLRFAGNGGVYSGFCWVTCELCGGVSIAAQYHTACLFCGMPYSSVSGPATARIITATVAAMNITL